MRALPCILSIVVLLCASCAGPKRVNADGWGIERRFDGRTPGLLSISQINAGTKPAAGAIVRVPVRARERSRQRIVISADKGIAATWTAGAALFDPQLDRALQRLAALGANQPREIELRLTLMPSHGARQQRSLHPAATRLVIDLLIPVATQPRSRSAVLDAALATGLHEAAHAMRPTTARDRGDDEYRASLVAACFRIDGVQRSDIIAFNAHKSSAQADFTRVHSAAAAQAVQRDLASTLGKPTLDGGDRAGIAALQVFCAQRLAKPAR